jgi:hypothetical protein
MTSTTDTISYTSATHGLYQASMADFELSAQRHQHKSLAYLQRILAESMPDIDWSDVTSRTACFIILAEWSR